MTAPARKRRRWPWMIGGLLLLIILLFACTAGGSGTTATSHGPTSSPSAAGSPAAQDPMTSKGWHAKDIRITPNGLGGIDITARVTNQQAVTRSSVFTLTMLRNGQTVATATGSANDVPGGRVVTVDFVSTDKLSSTSSLEYQFQSDF